MRDAAFYQRHPEYLTQTRIWGVYEGLVVGVDDTQQRRRVQVHVPAINGDFNGRKLESYRWARTFAPAGASPGYDLWDSVLVAYEAGAYESPMVVGKIDNNMPGNGTLPSTRVPGYQGRPEGWAARGNFPEAQVVGSTGSGNVIWFEDKFINSNNLASSVSLMDTGGKNLKFRSVYIGGKPYVPDASVPDKSKDLYKADLPARVSMRDGDKVLVPGVPGSIELGTQQTKKTMVLTGDQKSIDSNLQTKTDGTIQIEYEAVDGEIFTARQSTAALDMASGSMFLTGAQVLAANFMTLPRKW